ncbi:MAG: GntR family transcriptional regulator [Pseudomonadota bacterium]
MAGIPDEIAGSLIGDILSGRYQVRDRLPSERDLATRFSANRGAVREAMKKLEQIGLAEIQPGGARVKDTSEASLDVLGHMLGQGDLPDALLVDQILVVINSLLSVAAEQTLELASENELASIRALTLPFLEDKLSDEAHTLARFELMRSIMLTNKNLPLQLIAKTLFEQVAPHLAHLKQHVVIDHDAFATFARQLDRALAERDLPAVHATFTAFSNLNRESMLRAFERARRQAREASLS